MSCSSISSLRTVREEQKKIEAQLTKKLEEQKTVEAQLRKQVEDQRAELDAKKLSEDQLKKLSTINEAEKQIKELDSRIMGLKSELLRATNKSGETEIKLKESKFREQDLQTKITKLEDSMSSFSKAKEGLQAKEKEMQLLQAQYDETSKLSQNLQSKVNSLTLEMKSKDEFMEEQKAVIDHGLEIITNFSLTVIRA